jgi:Cd2+/Zn2+-exporting ATPase
MIYNSPDRRNKKRDGIQTGILPAHHPIIKRERRFGMLTERIYVIRGMDCAEEVEALKGTVGRLQEVRNLTFNLLNGTMTVEADQSLPDGAILEATRRAGLTAVPFSPSSASDGGPPPATLWERRGRPIMCILSGALLAGGFAAHAVDRGSVLTALASTQETSGSLSALTVLCYLGATILGGWHIVPKAAASLSSLRPDMNLLMTVAVLGAAAIGEWFEAGTVAFLFALALLLESWSVSRARHAIRALTHLSPSMACQVCPRDGDLMEVPVAEVPVGATIVVRPGERIPLDGVITEGRTTVNQAPITGESYPVARNIDDEVLAGTINQDGAVSVRVTKPAANTTLARIIRMVEEAQGRRAPVEQWVDHFSRYYTPAMIGMALLVAVVPPLLFDGPWAKWFYEALVMLVIACPCALVISTPVGIIAGLTAAARKGVLIKGGIYLEMAARLRAIALDKTGTLTHGNPQVQAIVPFHPHAAAEVLAIAASLEASSLHPMARAIRRKCETEPVRLETVTDFQAIPGKGASGIIRGKLFWIGSHRLMHEQGAETPAIHAAVQRLEDAGHSVLVVGCDREILGLISVADRVRESAASMIAALRHQGIERIVMLTGDNEETARAVAAEAGVDAYHAELLPEDKMHLVHTLTQDYRHVGMVGDGVNDAPAMAAASLAVAMGAAGSDAAIETADIALMNDDLTRLPWLIAHARRTLSTIRANVFFALGLKAAVMLLAVAGIASLWMAIAADMGASLIVVFWSLRLLRE